jgi:hypothetical protein
MLRHRSKSAATAVGSTDEGWKMPEGMTCSMPPAIATLRLSRRWRMNDGAGPPRIVSVEIAGMTGRRAKANGLPSMRRYGRSRSRGEPAGWPASSNAT